MLSGPRRAAPFPSAVVSGDEAQGLGIEKRVMAVAEIEQDALDRGNPLGALESVFKRVRPGRTELHFLIPFGGLDQSGGGGKTGKLT